MGMPCLGLRVFTVFVCSYNLVAAAVDDPSPFGVGTSAQASGLYASWMPKMAAAGVHWVRIFPEWNQNEPSAGTWNWSLADSILSAAATNHLSVSGALLYNASWVNANTHTFPTNNYPAWFTYVSNAVAHAAGRVRYWEVWNEPESFAAGGTPADYARVVTNAYNAAKAADPNAQVGLSVASVDVLYLEQAILAGAADHFDYICVHPYEDLGAVDAGEEAQFMSIVPTIRKMLAARDPAKWQAPIWITEIGEALGGQVTATSQAQDLVKAYTLAIAQGVSHVEWFEARDGGYAMGLLDSSGNLTPAYTALQNLTATLGPNPTYLGWVMLNNKDYVFAFQGPATNVLAAWAPPNSIDSVSFGQVVSILNPLNGTVTSASVYSLSNAPVLVIGAPAGLVAQAQTNKFNPLPWAGNYSGASSISVTMGSPNTELGLHQLNADSSSTAVTVYGGPARDCSKASIQYFTVDPSFLSYTHASIKISAVVRRDASNDNAGFNLKYESATGRKSIGWNTVPGNSQWYTMTWTIADDEFVGDWGYHFTFDSDSTTYSKYYIQQVTVTNLVPRPVSAPSGLLAVPGVGQVALQWNAVSGATGYNLKRATISGGSYATIGLGLTSTSYLDAGLVPGVPCYYVVSAVNTGGEGPLSAEANATPLLPTLAVAWVANNTLRLSWPASVMGATLQQAVALPGVWSNSTAVVQVQGTSNFALVTNNAQASFYRLLMGPAPPQ